MFHVRNSGCQPDVVPSPKRGVDIVVVATEARAQVTVAVRDASRLDRLDPDVLDEHMRRDEHEAGHWVTAPGMDDRDRGAVAVADEERTLEAELGEQRWEHDQRLVVHVRHRPWFGRRGRSAVAVARVRHRRHVTERGPHVVDEPLPQVEGPEPFVQEDDRWTRLA